MPVDGKASLPPKREAMRQYTQQSRDQRKANGEARLDVSLPKEIVEVIDAVQTHHDLRNRSQAVKLLLEQLLANPDNIRELGL